MSTTLNATAELDSDTLAYILESRKHFEDLRQVSAQLAGLLVLAAAGSQSAGPHHPMLESAAQLYRETAEAIHRARVTIRARRHHQTLLRAAEALRKGLAAARSSPHVDLALAPLRLAHDELQRASRELPGFPMVAFEHGCCGSAA